MKVCTEACLFGAWLAAMIRKGELKNVHAVLDIGAGTGVLSLMLAQATDINSLQAAQKKYPDHPAMTGAVEDRILPRPVPVVRIDAVELDEKAAAQANRNFMDSPWKERLTVFPGAIQEFDQKKDPYNLLVSNPPFYKNDLRSDNTQRNMAMHGSSLPLDQLLDVAGHLLHPNGYFALILPFHRSEEFEKLLPRFSLQVWKRVRLRQTPAHPFFRSMYLLCHSSATISITENDIIIRDGENYSTGFEDLLKDYYLNIT